MAELPHTPTPWTPHKGNSRTVASVLPGGSVPIAVFSNATDADFAMQAANCHDDVVEALGDVLRILDAVRYSSGLGTKQLDRMDRARIAFANAKGAPAAPPSDATAHASTSPGPANCQTVLMAQGKPYPRTCERCGLGPCPFFDKDGNSLRKGGAS